VQIPNGFVPSDVVRRTYYDPEGRMLSFNISRQSTGGVSAANSLLATDAEHFDVCAPFLRRNKLNDAKRRNYVVQPGGAILYFDEDVPGSNRRSTAELLDPKISFGHDSLDATRMADTKVAFTVGSPAQRGDRND